MSVNCNCIKANLFKSKVVPTFLEKPSMMINVKPVNVITSESDSFRNAIRFPAWLGQVLCLIPLSDQSFRWGSIRIIMAIIVAVSQAVMALFSLAWLSRSGINIFKGGTLLYFTGASIMMCLMIRLAIMWPKLIRKWEEIESYFGYQKYLTRIFALASILILILSTDLQTTSQNNYRKILKSYSKRMFPQVYDTIPYSLWRAIPVIYMNSVTTLMYSFGDQLIIMISLALGNYFQIYNQTMYALKGKILSPNEWKAVRLKYSKLCELSGLVDNCLCHLLFLTFVIHLHILSVEMHQGILRDTHNEIGKIRAITMFVIFVLRTCALCLTTVRIYDQSRVVLNILYAVPSSSYCAEVELFTRQVLKSEIVLTGSNLFSMKRSFLLTIGGTIISYEILLLQMKDFSTIGSMIVEGGD